jgi:hypothetical protein
LYQTNRNRENEAKDHRQYEQLNGQPQAVDQMRQIFGKPCPVHAITSCQPRLATPEAGFKQTDEVVGDQSDDWVDQCRGRGAACGLSEGRRRAVVNGSAVPPRARCFDHDQPEVETGIAFGGMAGPMMRLKTANPHTESPARLDRPIGTA